MAAFRVIKGGITAPAGFLAAGVAAGIKEGGKKDLALIYSETLADAAGVFTRNRVKAAPVKVSEEQLSSAKARAIVANSGNANCSTGTTGTQHALKMVNVAARAVNVSPRYVLVASTGKIGVPLPIDKVLAGISQAAKVLSRSGAGAAARAIMTTDTRPKEIALRVPLSRGITVTLGGMAKGAGMIAPDMATLLSFITTDAAIRAEHLKPLLAEAAAQSFNMLTVDNEMSTNDTVFILANGLAKNRPLAPGSPDFEKFKEALRYLCVYLAREIARDGEGATRLLEVKVINAPTAEDARRVAKKVAGAALVKAMLFGKDPNWGRIMAAAGASGVDLDPAKVAISVGKELLVRRGEGIPFNAKKVKKLLAKPEVLLTLDLNLGRDAATSWGCDLTCDYVKINAKYST